MASNDTALERSGYPKYIKEGTIQIIEEILIPVLSKVEERDVKFSEVVHTAVVFFKQKHGYTKP